MNGFDDFTDEEKRDIMAMQGHSMILRDGEVEVFNGTIGEPRFIGGLGLVYIPKDAQRILWGRRYHWQQDRLGDGTLGPLELVRCIDLPLANPMQIVDGHSLGRCIGCFGFMPGPKVTITGASFR